jgi:hypothetical protein
MATAVMLASRKNTAGGGGTARWTEAAAALCPGTKQLLHGDTRSLTDAAAARAGRGEERALPPSHAPTRAPFAAYREPWRRGGTEEKDWLKQGSPTPTKEGPDGTG